MATKKKQPKKKSAAPARASKPAARKASKPATKKAAAPRGLNLTAITPSLTVNDIAASIAWYCDVLGFKVADRWQNGDQLLGAEIKAGGSTFFLGQDDWKKGRDRVKGEGFRLFCETNQDVDAIAAAIKSRGGTLTAEPRDEFGRRHFAIDDPSGYKITISSTE
jgi:uncharacterized glyoxalase superfamily protein PhnB